MEDDGDGDANCIWCTRNDLQRNGKRALRVGSRRTSRDYPNYNVVEVGENTEKSPGDLSRLAVCD